MSQTHSGTKIGLCYINRYCLLNLFTDNHSVYPLRLQREVYYRLQSRISSVWGLFQMIHYGNGEPPFIQEIEQNVWQYCWRVFSCSLLIFVLLTLTPDLRNKSRSSRLLKIKSRLSLPSDYRYNYSLQLGRYIYLNINMAFKCRDHRETKHDIHVTENYHTQN